QASLPAGSHAAEGVALTSSTPPALGSRSITVVSGLKVCESSGDPSQQSSRLQYIFWSKALQHWEPTSAKATSQTRILSSSQPRSIGARVVSQFLRTCFSSCSTFNIRDLSGWKNDEQC
ncbi:unnamed protein product, partial [Musa acuminata subsp. burmannicoides]